MKKILLSLFGLLFISLTAIGQSINITSPNGGEVWQGCTIETITWTHSGTSDFYSIDYSVDNGSTWTSIATFYNTTVGEYDWTVPNIQSTQVLIRVQDSNNNAIEDISASTFAMTAPLLLTSPNGAETIEGGSNHTITWIDYQVNYVSLELSLDGGNTWSYIDSYESSDGNYSWTVPNTPSTQCLVRITDTDYPCKTDKSDFVFTISPATPVINVTSPSDGTNLYVGNSAGISWNSQFVVSNQVQIEYSTDNGSTWSFISTITENDGYYAWNVPDDVSNQCIVRVTDLTNTSTFGDSSGNFSIAQPFIDILYPDGGEVEVECEYFVINWAYGGVNPNNRFSLYYSTDGGSSWSTIATNVYQSNSSNSQYGWSNPPVNGSVLIKVVDYYNSSLEGISSAPYTMTPNSDIIVIYPNGGESLEAGTSHTITWADNAINYCQLELSIDGGSTWSYIDSYESSDGSYSWTVPNTPSPNCLVRITDTDYYCKNDQSDAVFEIAPPTPVISNISPGNSDNQVLYGDQNISITWGSAFLTSPFVGIDVSYDGGATYTEIVSVTENDSYYVWSAPATYSENCLIRIREQGSAVQGVSTYAFAIREPFIDILYPDGGEVEVECEYFVINWAYGGVNPNNRFSLYYSTDGGTQWNTIATNVYQSNSSNSQYGWSNPPVNGSVLIRVTDYYNSDLSGVSDAPYTMSPNNDIVVTFPNGGEILEAGTTHSITWADNAINYCQLELSTDGGSTWSYIDSYESSDGIFSWTVPDTPSTNCLIRITDTDYYCKNDESDAVFTIAPPTPVITNVNPGNSENQVHFGDQNLYISWNSAFLTGTFVAIDISYNGGSTYSEIIAATENDGNFSWAAPAVYSEDCRVRVREVGTSVEGVSVYPFAIREPFIDVIYPDGGETEIECNYFVITWEYGGVNPNNRFSLQYSTDAGSTWNTIATNVYQSNSSNSQYGWSNPPVNGSVLIRILDYYNSSLFGISDAPFNMTPNTDMAVTFPNGTETLEAGTTHTITWVDNAINYCQIELSVDGGNTWSYIDSYESSDGNYTWSVPNTPSTECLVRITDTDYYCKNDESDSFFTISPPTPVITSVSPGNSENQVVYGDQNVYIYWSSAYLTSTFVSIEVSYDNGATYTEIIGVTEDDGSYLWAAPATYSENCLIRVTELGSAVAGVSTYSFALREPFIDLLYPDGGEVEVECEYFVINWAYGGVNPNNRFSLYYSTDGGSTWNTIATNVYQSNSSNSQYGWSNPPVSGSVLIRIADYYNSSLEGISAAPYTMTPNSDMIVTYPNGGETLEAGTSHTITWADNAINYCQIELSIDGGSTWSYIDSYESSDGSYSWVVPNTPSPNCLVRITDTDYYCKKDESDTVFEITPPTPVIYSISPGNSDNQVHYGDQNMAITWSSAFLTSPFVGIDVSYDGGATYTEIVSITENDSYYVWPAPATYSENCLIRISEQGSAVEGFSEYAFAIREPFIDVLYPDGGEVEVECDYFVINWAYGGVNPNNRFSLYYSTDGGTIWNTIATNVYQSNSSNSQYGWSNPPVSGSVLIRIVDYYNSSLSGVSDAPYTMSPNNDMIVTSPNGGETLIVGTTHSITWADNAINYCQIELSTDGGSTWSYIDSYESSDGLYTWTVPNIPSSNCLVRITDTDYYCKKDQSDSVFSIEQPSPTVTYPNGGETLYQGQSINISWTSQFFEGTFVTTEYSTDNGATWTVINAAENNDGTAAWIVPEDYSANALVRVSEVGNPASNDVSDAVFIISPSIVVTSPNGDNGIQEWRVCTETTITWTSGGTSNYFRLWYSIDNGNTWVSLNQNYYSPGLSNTYDWIMPNLPTPAALVRVEDRYNASQVDYSDDTFTIAPAITVLTPNGGEILGAGNVVDITWLNEGATNYYDLDYSTTGGATWTNIAVNAFVMNESYSWTVPGSVGTNYLIRVTDNIDNCKTDVSDATFEVSPDQQGVVNLVSPNGLETWAGCSQQTIEWTSLATSDNYDIEYSLDGGSSWLPIVTDYYTLSKQYTWTIPNSASVNALVRVTDHNSLLFSDESNIEFEITAPSANAGDDVVVCSGGTTILQASGGLTYSWTPGSSLDNALVANPLASPTGTTIYTVTVTDSEGCTATDDVTVFVDNGLCDVNGCMDTEAFNFNPNATVDSGFCLYENGSGGTDTCPTDINEDGQTDTNDLLLMLGGFGTDCN